MPPPEKLQPLETSQAAVEAGSNNTKNRLDTFTIGLLQAEVSRRGLTMSAAVIRDAVDLAQRVIGEVDSRQ